ncbi:hypothetical protein CR513_44372, partial [Mucuna pruriens]
MNSAWKPIRILGSTSRKIPSRLESTPVQFTPYAHCRWDVPFVITNVFPYDAIELKDEHTNSTFQPKIVRGNRLDYQRTLVDPILSVLANGVLISVCVLILYFTIYVAIAQSVVNNVELSRLELGLDLVISSSTTIAMVGGDDPPLLVRTLRIKSTKVRWYSNRSPLFLTYTSSIERNAVDSTVHHRGDVAFELEPRWLWIADVECQLAITPDWAICLPGPSLDLVERLSAWASSGGLREWKERPVNIWISRIDLKLGESSWQADSFSTGRLNGPTACEETAQQPNKEQPNCLIHVSDPAQRPCQLQLSYHVTLGESAMSEIEKSKIIRGDCLDYQRTLVYPILSVLPNEGEPSPLFHVYLMHIEMTKNTLTNGPFVITNVNEHQIKPFHKGQAPIASDMETILLMEPAPPDESP